MIRVLLDRDRPILLLFKTVMHKIIRRRQDTDFMHIFAHVDLLKLLLKFVLSAIYNWFR